MADSIDVTKVDVAVIGAGVLGCFVARELSRYCLDVCVLEASHDVAMGATRANSGIIHTGFHPRALSLKGTSCVAGNAAYDRIVQELDVPFARIGALYVAFGPEGLARVKDKQANAAGNGAGHLEIVSGDEARSIEPRLSEAAIAAMVAPTTGVISPFALCTSLARNAAANGVEFCFGFRVDAVDAVPGGWRLSTEDGRSVQARYVVNMAGEEAALIDAQVHPADIVVRPRRGQYLVFDKQADAKDGKPPISHVLFQSQETDEKGTLIAPTTSGNILVGPTSETVYSYLDDATTQAGMDHITRVARKLVPDLEFGRVIAQFAGIRANITNMVKEKKDFVVRTSAPGFVSALGIKNPGITSAPSLADLAVRLLEKDGLRLKQKAQFDPCDQGCHQKAFLSCTPEQQRELLAQDASYGHVLCRCEHVTEGDVRACLRENPAPVALDGLKRRLRLGMGRCQGSFCLPRVAQVMADELGCQVSDLRIGEAGGRVSKGAVK